GVHGALSGMVKNVLDYVEDMAKDEAPYLHDLPVGLIGTAASGRDLGTVLLSLRCAVHALRGWPTPLGVAVNERLPAFDADGRCVPQFEAQLRTLAGQVIEFKRDAREREEESLALV